jgi:chemotaxis protein histidine kinase CheA
LPSDQFIERIAAVRQRFIAKLDGRIGQIESAIAEPARAGSMDRLAQAHRHAHDLCGVGPTMGFVATGQAARQVEQLLLVALKAERMLSEAEVALVTENIARLRSAARSEAQSAEKT